MSAKRFLAIAFVAAAGIGGNVAWLNHADSEARKLVTQKTGDVVKSSDTAILWGDRHGCPVTGSGTSYTAQDANGNTVKGVVCKPVVGSPWLR
jgi:hypothetical protein